MVGAPTGPMDQMASLRARSGHLLFLDTRSLTVRQVPFDLAGWRLSLLVIDTRASHELVGGEYAERRRSCARAAELLRVPALRDVRPEDLPRALNRIDDDVLRRRVRHVVTENVRVLRVVEALAGGSDPRAIGPVLTASHASMRDDFEITVPAVDIAVEAALAAGALGARMTGGGFGGSAIALLPPENVDPLRARVEAAFAARSWAAPHVFVVQPAPAAAREDEG